MGHDRRTVLEDSASVRCRSFLSGSLTLLGSTLLPRAGVQAAVAASELDFASALTAARAIRRGDVSSVELTTRVLERIKQFNPRLNAIVTLTADAALARARAADEALARGEWWGPFHGVPCTIKDTFETAEVRTTAGAPSLASHVPKADAAVVSRLRAAGVVILGKTNVPLMARDVQSYNEIFGTTNNPWDLSRTPGGSSGGEAAALAAGLSYLGVGSDIGGSIRTPAHFCGVYGHKPTLNLVPFRGHIPPPPGGPPRAPADLAVAGPLARAAGDLRVALEVLGGPDDEGPIGGRFRQRAAPASPTTGSDSSWTIPPAQFPRTAVRFSPSRSRRSGGGDAQRWPADPLTEGAGGSSGPVGRHGGGGGARWLMHRSSCTTVRAVGVMEDLQLQSLYGSARAMQTRPSGCTWSTAPSSLND